MERIDGSGNIVERRDYAGSFVFEGERLTEVLTEEGRLIPSRAVKPDFFVRDHLGSVRAVVSGDGRVLEANSYYPYGMKIDALSKTYYTKSDVKNRYKYNGKELFSENGLDWLGYGARFYDAAVGMWWVRDPKAEKAQAWTPYSYVGGNPVNAVDLWGMEISPIYDFEGNFLGTDDQGLQGEAIVMDISYFRQGMSHQEALEKGYTLYEWAHSKDFTGVENYVKIENHYKSLPQRPDYDGVLTKSEADKWWLSKSGKPLYVDESKIKLPGITTASFDNEKGKSIYKNFLWCFCMTGDVYGTIKLTLIDPGTGKVKIGGDKYLDKYDFNYDGRILRDIAVWLGRPGPEKEGKDFYIIGYNYATVPVKKKGKK